MVDGSNYTCVYLFYAVGIRFRVVRGLPCLSVGMVVHTGYPPLVACGGLFEFSVSGR